MPLLYPRKAFYELPTDQQTSKASSSKHDSPCNITEDDLVSDNKKGNDEKIWYYRQPKSRIKLTGLQMKRKTSSLRLLAMLAFKESLWTTEFRIWDFDPWKFEEMIYDAP